MAKTPKKMGSGGSAGGDTGSPKPRPASMGGGGNGQKPAPVKKKDIGKVY